MRVTGFTAALALATGVLVAQSVALAPASRAVPLGVLLPTLLLLIAQVAREGKAVPQTGSREALSGRGRRAWRLAAWGSALLALVFALGFLVAAPVYLVPYLRVEAGLSWARAVLLGALASGLLYVAFGLALDVPFPPGLFG